MKNLIAITALIIALIAIYISLTGLSSGDLVKMETALKNAHASDLQGYQPKGVYITPGQLDTLLQAERVKLYGFLEGEKLDDVPVYVNHTVTYTESNVTELNKMDWEIPNVGSASKGDNSTTAHIPPTIGWRLLPDTVASKPVKVEIDTTWNTTTTDEEEKDVMLWITTRTWYEPVLNDQMPAVVVIPRTKPLTDREIMALEKAAKAAVVTLAPAKVEKEVKTPTAVKPKPKLNWN